MAATLEKRVDDLERRVSEIEGQLGFLLPTMRQVHLDLLGFKEETAENFADVRRSIAGLDRRLGGVETKVDALDRKTDALPRVLAEMLDERQKKKS